LPSLSNLPPPPLDTEISGPDDKTSPSWSRWLQLLGSVVRGIFETGLTLDRGDSSSSPGDATLNTPSGFSAIDAGNSTISIENNLVKNQDIVFAQVHQEFADATLTHVARVKVYNGVFNIYGNAAATSDVVVQWFIVGS
jgi:hypothetical protein